MNDDVPADNGVHAPAARHRLVDPQDLPLCCPRPDDPLWNAHPKIYLPLEESGKASCPYCGAVYKLKTLFKS